MAAASQITPDIKKSLVLNFKNTFPSIKDSNLIVKVLDNENWDFQKSFHILKKLQNEFNHKPKEIKKKTDAVNVPRTKAGEKTCLNKSEATMKNSPKSKSAPTMGETANQDKKKKRARKKKAEAENEIQKDANSPGMFHFGNFQKENKNEKLSVKKTLKTKYEIIKKSKDPLQRILAFSKLQVKVMVFLRGCAGSGKTTFGKQVLTKIGIKSNHHLHLFSADDFFIDDKTGLYTFNPEFISFAHEWNHKMVRQAAREGRSPIIIDNTHTRLWEMKENAITGVEYGYIIETLEPKTPWFFMEDVLFKKTVHSVSRESIRRMIDRYELNLTGQDVIKLLKLFYKQHLLPPQRQANLPSVPSNNYLKAYKSKLLFNNKDKEISNCFTKMQLNSESCEPQQSNQQRFLQFSKRSKPPVGFSYLDKRQENFNLQFGTVPSLTDSNSVELPQSNNVSFDKMKVNKEYTSPTVSDPYCDQENTSIPSTSTSPFITSFEQLPQDLLFNKSDDSGTSDDNIESEGEENDDEDDEIDEVEEDGGSEVDDENENEKESSTNSLNRMNSDGSLSSGEKNFFHKSNCTEYVLIKPDESLLFQNVHSDCPSNLTQFLFQGPRNSDCSLIIDETKVTNNINICKEYVLIMADQSLLFQKEHSDCPTNLNQFIDNSIPPNNPNVLNEESENDCEKLNKDFDEFIKSYLKDNEEHSDRKFDANFEQFVNNETLANNDISGNMNLLTESVQDTTTVEECKPNISSKYPTQICDDSETAITELAVPESNNLLLTKEEKNRTTFEASTNTNYVDFKVLRQINRRDMWYRDDVIVARPTFQSAPFINSGTIPSKLMLDKGSMTLEIESNLIEDFNFAIESLIRMFPMIKQENLEELFNKCGRDLDWAVNLLLDSGHVMCEYSIPEKEEETCITAIEEQGQTTEQPQETVALIEEAGAIADQSCMAKIYVPSECNISNVSAPQSPTNKSDKKKKKKSSTTLTDTSLDLIQDFQDKFVLKDDCYSENINKLRRQKLVNTEQKKGSTINTEHLPRDSTVEIDVGNEKCFDQTPKLIEEDVQVQDEEEEEEDPEFDVSLVMDKNLVIQLQNKFGSILNPNLIGDKTIIHIPKSLARQLYSYTFDSVYEHLEEQQSVIDFLINEGMEAEEQNEVNKVQPSFQEIMDHEIALRMSQVKDNSRANTAASTLSRTLLIERFPNIDPTTLKTVLEDANHSLHEATNLLTSAGHHITNEESNDVAIQEAESEPLSREEAIQQAHAYSDVVGKLCDMREECLNKAEEALANGKRTVAKYYSEMAKWYMERIEQSNSMAASAMLSGYEGANTLDLHFLQVQQALKVLDLFLDEKIRELPKKKRVIAFIITGRGKHSPKGVCKIKQVTQARLQKRQIQFAEQNPGMLKAIITKTALVSYNQNENLK